MVFTQLLPIPKNLMTEHTSSLIIGKTGTCKTSILFRYCQSIADQYPNQPAIFISANQLYKLPLLIEGYEQVPKKTIERVRLIYPESLEQLIDYLATFFTLNQIPSVFVVDDLNLILKKRTQSIERTYDQIISRVFALLADNAGYCKWISDKPCRLLVATSFDNQEELMLFNSIGEHYFEQIYMIKPCKLLGTTCTGFEVITNDESNKLILQVQDDEIKLKHILKKKRSN